MRTPLPAKCALQFLIGHTAFLIAIRVQDIERVRGCMMK